MGSSKICNFGCKGARSGATFLTQGTEVAIRITLGVLVTRTITTRIMVEARGNKRFVCTLISVELNQKQLLKCPHDVKMVKAIFLWARGA